MSTNFIVGLLVLRFLSIREYALYVTASVLLAIGSLGSDLGISQAVNTLGSRLRADKQRLSALVAGAYIYRRYLFFMVIFVIIAVAFYMMRGGKWSLFSVIASVSLVVLTSWIQNSVSIKKSVLHIHHNADGLFQAGIAEAFVRLVLVFICVIWATAVAALMVNLAGVFIGRIVLSRKCRPFLTDNIEPSDSQNRAIRSFVIPLIPTAIYYLLQGQLSIILLNYYGYTSAVAEVGALGRLGQIIVLPMLLNPFLIQPYLARLTNKKEFVTLSGIVLFGLIAFSFIAMVSVYRVPQWWLYILGSKYSGLGNELPLALLGAALTLSGATLYTMVVSRNFTIGQTWTVVFGLASQIIFISSHGVLTTADALILNLLPMLTYALIQAMLLTVVIAKWEPVHI